MQASKVVSLDWYRSVVEEVNEGSMMPYVPVFALYRRRDIVGGPNTAANTIVSNIERWSGCNPLQSIV